MRKIKKRILQMIVFILSFLTSLFIKKIFKKYSRQKLKYEPIFIVGAPRTGSTLLYQLICNHTEVIYINNFTCFFFQKLFTGFWLSNKFLKLKFRQNYKSKYGYVEGINAPSECGRFWYRWLPKYKHFVDHGEISRTKINEIKFEITACTNYFNRPLLFKNLNAGQRLRLLRKAFPNSKFIFIRRDPLHVAQSIIKSKRNLKIPLNHFWSIKPPNVEKLKKLSWPEQIIKQIYHLEKQIAKDLKLFPRKNIYLIDYKDIKLKNINFIAKKFNLKKKFFLKYSKINLNNKLNLKKKEVSLLKKEIKKLNWKLTNV